MTSLMSSFRLFASRRGVALPNLLLQRSLVTGNVKWFNTTKGFGFIAARNEEGQEVDYFVHQSSILMDGYRFLEEGENVEFDVAAPTAGRGPTATNVKSLSPTKKNIRPPLRQGDGGQGRSGGSFGKRDGGGFRSRGGNDRGRRREGEEDDF